MRFKLLIGEAKKDKATKRKPEAEEEAADAGEEEPAPKKGKTPKGPKGDGKKKGKKPRTD